ncbi:MAG: alcohol dehydrogenase catalytic domain-containing protein [Chloroflexi bacterium]|nr:alcohol dehydrogenase catalytic domain-containing protein [Chloroflexota bacterium]
MSSTMRQAVTAERRRVEVGMTPVPSAPGPGEALLAIASVGVCGSDLAMWEGTDPYTRYPVRQGHEASARVLQLGPGGDGRVREGDLVAVEPLLPDGTCVACRRGRPNCCVGLRVIGAHVDGALAEQLVMPVANLYPVPDLDAELAAFVEPVSIGLQMVTRSRIGAGDRAVVLGAGPIGQAIQLAAIDRGARILAVDRVPGRLERALARGAEVAVDARDGKVAEAVEAWTEGDGPEVVFEATGVTAVIRQAIELVAHAGTVVIAGTPTDDVALPALTIVRKELDILGSRNNTGLYPAAIDLVRRERDRCRSLITHRFPLAETQAAMTFAAANPAEANKVMITVAP